MTVTLGDIDRRTFLLSLGALLSYGPPVAWGQANAAKIDIHNHIFNLSDLPISGFLSHLAGVPRKLIKKTSEKVHELTDSLTPSGSDELALLDAPFDGAMVRVQPNFIGAAKDDLLAQGALSAFGRDEGVANRALDKLLGNVPSDGSKFEQGKGLLTMLALSTRYRHEIAANIVQTFSGIDLFTPAMVDFTYWDHNGMLAETSLATQVRVQEKIAKLSIRGKIGRDTARIHPFVPFNPLREVVEVMDKLADPLVDYTNDRITDLTPDPVDHNDAWHIRGVNPPEGEGALKLVRIAIEQAGFVGVKMYPPVGFLPLINCRLSIHAKGGIADKLDRALRVFYKYCEDNAVPITTHTNASNAYASGYGQLAEPRLWWPVLNEFPNLRLNLGHFGHTTGSNTSRGLRACESWMRQAAVLMQNFEHVYADVSNSKLPSDSDYAEQFTGLLKELFTTYPKCRKRLMYGSDWWMNVRTPDHLKFPSEFEKHFSDIAGKLDDGDLTRDLMGENALRFLGFDNPGNANNQRLHAFYQNEPSPSWLASA